jgi:glycosyltransferase involved in cell wall biosynthesis
MKKKILIIIPSLVLGGGAEKIAASVTNRLSEKFKIYILTFYESKNIYPYKGNYITLKQNSKTWQKLFLPFKIYKKIKSIAPDIIMSFMDYTSIITFFTKFIFQIKVPLVVCSHTNPKIAYRNKLWYLKFFIKLVYPSKWINKIVTVSLETQYMFEKIYKIRHNKIKTIYNGISINEIQKLKNEKISDYNNIFYNNDVIKFITIGSLRKVKGHDYLIKAFSKVKDQLPNSKLIIIGDGPLRKELEQLIEKLSLKDDVHLMGLQKNPYKYMAKSDIFVFSSKYEGFPNALLEALACGLPIISIDCETGPREILDHSKYGLLVDENNFDDLINNMLLLAKNKDLMKKYSILSLERAEYFDFNQVSGKWIKFLETQFK